MDRLEVLPADVERKTRERNEAGNEKVGRLQLLLLLNLQINHPPINGHPPPSVHGQEKIENEKVEKDVVIWVLVEVAAAEVTMHRHILLGRDRLEPVVV